MSTSYLTITPHDPVIARDARPFSLGARMKSHDWMYPSVVAGSLRTMLGKMRDCDFSNPDVPIALKQVSVAGPLPVWNNQLFFPAPKDFQVKEEKGHRVTYLIRPAALNDGEYCDFPQKGLQPALLPEEIEEFKPAKNAAFWSSKLMETWLLESPDSEFKAPPKLKPGCASPDSLNLPEKDSRIHARIRPETLVTEEGMLYETIGLDLNLKKYPEGIRMAARVSAENDFKNVLSTIDGFAPTGGKRRVSYWKADDKPYAGWACPEKIRDAISLSSKVRMVLATPAIFSNGWYPDWIKEKGDFLEGTPPGLSQNIKLRLVSACTDRWKPLSGYSLERKNRGFKALRRLVPSGSVYFFEVAEGNAKDLTDLWLSSVSDDEQDRRDGFGLALWGIWKNFTKVENTKQSQEE